MSRDESSSHPEEGIGQEKLENEPISSAEPSAIQEFAHSIISICALADEAKLSSKEAYQQIKDHWKELKRSMERSIRVKIERS